MTPEIQFYTVAGDKERIKISLGSIIFTTVF